MTSGAHPVRPPRGWYADPDGAATLRWWDGAAWTETTEGLAEHPPPPWNVFAIVALATGAAGLFFVAIPLGVIGLRQAPRRGERGREFALAGLITGIVMFVYLVLVVVGFVVAGLAGSSHS